MRMPVATSPTCVCYYEGVAAFQLQGCKARGHAVEVDPLLDHANFYNDFSNDVLVQALSGKRLCAGAQILCCCCTRVRTCMIEVGSGT
jgi:hypothetical protein